MGYMQRANTTAQDLKNGLLKPRHKPDTTEVFTFPTLIRIASQQMGFTTKLPRPLIEEAKDIKDKIDVIANASDEQFKSALEATLAKFKVKS